MKNRAYGLAAAAVICAAALLLCGFCVPGRTAVQALCAPAASESQAHEERAKTAALYGIDVSVYQDDIDFAAVKRQGIKAVYIRAGAGDESTDEQFLSNYEKAKKEGLALGFYYYATPRDIGQAQRQAARFAALLAGKEYTLRPAMDFESYGNLDDAAINRVALAFLQQLEEDTGVTPAVYSDAYRARRLWDSRLTAYPLWLADYGSGEVAPPFAGVWSEWSGYQYSDVGRLEGIEDPVDLDLFRPALFLR